MSSRKQYIRQFCLANMVLAVFNAYVVFRLAAHAPLYKHKFLLSLFTLLLMIIQNIVYLPSKWLIKFEQSLNSRQVIYWIYQVSYLLFGIMTCLFCYTLVMDIIGLMLKLSSLADISRYFDHYYLTIITAITAFTVIFGIKVAAQGPHVERVTIPLKNLPRGFDDFKIVQISDLHVGKTIRRDYVINVVNMVNSLVPDITALTGDFIDGSVQELKDEIAPLSQLKSRYGHFFVTGNHEYYSDATAWTQKFIDLGIKVLSNQHVLIRHHDDQIILAGITDHSTLKNHLAEASSPHKAVDGAPPDLLKILLAHQPISYEQAFETGYALQLSGHTHAGQYFPFTLLIRFFHRYYRGLNNHKGMWLYINRGTGYWGPALRLGASPEITLITLKSVIND